MYEYQMSQDRSAELRRQAAEERLARQARTARRERRRAARDERRSRWVKAA